MNFLLALLYLIIAAGVSYFIYFWSAALKVVSDATMEEINEAETNPKELVNEKETEVINYSSTFLFIIIGVLAWTFMGLFVGNFV